MGFILASSVAKSIGENMTNPEIRADVILAQLVPEEVAQTALAKLAVQKSLRLDFTEEQHIKCALPPVQGRTWAGKIRYVLHQKYGDARGFENGDLETEAVMLDLDTTIWPIKEIEAEWDADIEAEKERILEARNVNTR